MERGMRALLRPKSVAILGCSEDATRIGGRPLKYFLANGFTGQIYPVNPKYKTIGGLPCYARVSDIPGPIDLAVVALPAALVRVAIDELAEKRVPAAVVFSSGFAESGSDGAAVQRELVAAARAGGVRMCGPNAVGVLNAFDGVTATFSEYLEGPVSPGPVGFASQSGAFGTAIAALARERQLGFGYFVNVGNESDVDVPDALRFMVEDERISVIAAYLEGIRDGRKLLAVADRAMVLGKPFIVTKVGRSKAGARAAASHTGALAGSDTLFDDVFRQHGILRARDEAEMLDFIEIFCRCASPRGGNTCVVTQSGGAGVLACDRGEELGLAFPALAESTQNRLRGVLPSYASLSNPVDVTGLALAEPELMRAAMKTVLEDACIDIGVLWIRLMAGHVDLMIEILHDIKQSTGKTFVVCWVSPPPGALDRLRRDGICVCEGAARGVNAVGALVKYRNAREAFIARKGLVPVRPPFVCASLSDFPPGPVPTLEAAELLRNAGIGLVASALARSAEEAVTIAGRLGYPVALKIESPDIMHKTDIGGVKLNVSNENEIRAAFSDLKRIAVAALPNARIDGAIIQPMASSGIELVVGFEEDPAFGPVLMIGLGGIFVEVLEDVQFRTAPITEQEAEEMLCSLHAAKLLDGLRGMPPAHRGKLRRFLMAVSEMGAAMSPHLQSLDLNPVFATPADAVAVDWLMIAADRSSRAAFRPNCSPASQES